MHIQEVPDDGGLNRTAGREAEQPRVEEPDDDGIYPEAIPSGLPHSRAPANAHPGLCDPFYAAPGFSGDPWLGDRTPFGGHTFFSGHDPFADFGFRGTGAMLATMKTHMDSMRVDMVNGFAEARENSVSGGGSPFSYTCSQWTSVDGGRRGAKVEHRVAAYGSSDVGHHLKETVKDGRTGEIRVLREESQPVGYRRNRGSGRREAITNE